MNVALSLSLFQSYLLCVFLSLSLLYGSFLSLSTSLFFSLFPCLLLPPSCSFYHSYRSFIGFFASSTTSKMVVQRFVFRVVSFLLQNRRRRYLHLNLQERLRFAIRPPTDSTPFPGSRLLKKTTTMLSANNI